MFSGKETSLFMTNSSFRFGARIDCKEGGSRASFATPFSPPPSMDVDRPTQAFLTRFPDPITREAERLRSIGAVKQIFGGPSFVHARVEDGSDVYHITLKRTVS